MGIPQSLISFVVWVRLPPLPPERKEMARNKKTKMRFKDTKTSCPDYIKKEVDFDAMLVNWIPCGNGYRVRSRFMCKLNDPPLLCPFHWPRIK